MHCIVSFHILCNQTAIKSNTNEFWQTCNISGKQLLGKLLKSYEKELLKNEAFYYIYEIHT